MNQIGMKEFGLQNGLITSE